MSLDDPRLQRAIHDHIGLSETQAWKLFRRVPAADLDELRAIAAESLCQAADRWIAYCDARGFDPWDADDPELPEAHFGGYVVRTVQGALLDWARHQDHVTRSTRGRLKQIQAAGDGLTEQELAAATGLSVKQIREARLADAVRPSSLDYETPDGGAHEGFADRSDGADVAGQAELNGVLAGFAAAFDKLPPVQRVIVALTFHQELPLDVVAKSARLEPREARRLLDAAVCAVHNDLLLAVSGEGTAPRRLVAFAGSVPGSVR